MSLQDEVVKQPIKRLEIPISKFNDVAIPHHLDLFNRHKNNIKKFQGLRDWDRVYTEQINASRIVKQLKQLLHEMDTLRGQVLDSQISKFDKLTLNARTSTLNAIKEYLELELNLPLVQRMQHKDEEESQDLNPFDNHCLQLQAEQEELERQQACLHAWTSLQTDLQQLQQLFIDFNKLVHNQAELVNSVEENVEVSDMNIDVGAKHLQQASKYKVVAYPLAGAVLGTCLGGPVGFLAGLKFGGLTAIGGGLLGFAGGSILKKKHLTNTELKQIEAPPQLALQNSSKTDLNGTENKKYS